MSIVAFVHGFMPGMNVLAFMHFAATIIAVCSMFGGVLCCRGMLLVVGVSLMGAVRFLVVMCVVGFFGGIGFMWRRSHVRSPIL
jgi:hypothetical protein